MMIVDPFYGLVSYMALHLTIYNQKMLYKDESKCSYIAK